MKVKTLIVGLGNPGAKYARTRHNIGFAVLDALCDGKFKFEKKFNAEICELKELDSRLRGNDTGKRGGVVLMKPQTFMNLSGKAVKSYSDYYKIGPENIRIIHDEVDIPFGEIRIKQGGSSAGHKGVESVIQHLGSDNFWRFRVGVKNEDSGVIETENFVLQKFSKDEEDKLPEIIDLCVREIKEILNNGERGPKILKIE